MSNVSRQDPRTVLNASSGNAAVFIAVLALGALVFAAGRLSDRPILLPGGSLGESQVQDLGAPGTFRRAFVDPAGKTVVLESPPSAIVSVILGGDEMLARLVEPERVSSVTYLADDPGISNVAGFYPAGVTRNYGDIEEVIAAQPDLVLLAAFTNAVTAAMLLDAGIALLRFTSFDTHDDIRHNVRMLAQAVGEEARGEAWIAEMDQRLSAVRQSVEGRERPRVLFYGMSGSTAGPGSLMHETISLAGGKNVYCRNRARIVAQNLS
ncbi:MAG: ABC transporter substrate-binding protein [Pseudomonadota bacterium]